MSPESFEVGTTLEIPKGNLLKTNRSGFISPSNIGQAVAQFLDQFFDELDLQEFFSLFYWYRIFVENLIVNRPMIGTTVEKVVGDNYVYIFLEVN